MDLKFRIETKVDPSTGQVFAEAYFPDDAKTPLAVTDPIYPDHAVAEADILKIVRDAVREHIPKARETPPEDTDGA